MGERRPDRSLRRRIKGLLWGWMGGQRPPEEVVTAAAPTLGSSPSPNSGSPRTGSRGEVPVPPEAASSGILGARGVDARWVAGACRGGAVAGGGV